MVLLTGDTLTRLAVVGGFFGVGTLAWAGVTRLASRRAARQAPADPLLAGAPPGQPAIVYFSTRHCVPCRTQQQPALDRLAAEAGAAVRIIRIDALEQPELADRWGVFSAPTTIVLDGERTPRHINRGVASFETLERQLAGLTEGGSRR